MLSSNPRNRLVYVFAGVLLCPAASITAADCNGNEVDDAEDLTPGSLSLEAAEVYGIGAESAVAADFDGDDKVDLAMAPAAGLNVVPGVNILRNRGDGTFEPPVHLQGGDFWSIAAADFDGDGSTDLATGKIDTGSLWVHLNLGGGTFRAPVEYPAGDHADVDVVTKVVAADFNADGKPDLVASLVDSTTRPDAVSVLFNLGNGRFQTARAFDAGQSPLFLAAADLNADRWPDLATVHSGLDGGISVLLNNRDGTLGPGAFYAHATSYPFSSYLFAADMDGDSAPDLATSGFAGEVLAFQNQGDGSFDTPIELAPAGQALLAVAELDGDAKPELIVGHGSWDNITTKWLNAGFSVVRRQEGGTFSTVATHATSSRPTSVVVSDFDGGGRIDIAVVGSHLSELAVFLSRADGTLQATGTASTILRGPADARPILLASDLNADGRTDIAGIVAPDLFNGGCGFSPGHTAIFINHGGGVFPSPLSAEYEIPVGLQAAADFDGDGNTDLATIEEIDTSLSILVLGQSYFLPPIGRVVGLVACDWNGDGRQDLAATTSTSGIYLLLNSGDGMFELSDQHAGGGDARTVADVDGDKDCDLIESRVTGCFHRGCTEVGGIQVLLNDGGVFEAGWYGNSPGIGCGGLVGILGGPPTLLSAGDIDGDGAPDLVGSGPPDPLLGSAGLGVLLVLRNTGTGTFESPRTYLRSGDATLLTLADIDSDGRLDIVAADHDGSASILLNRTAPPTSLDLNHNNIPDECETYFHRGDPNSSGTNDISDGITIFGYLFLGNPATLACRESADANNDGAIDISDGIYLLSWLFTGGPEPATPGPTQSPCGVDPDPTGSAGDLGCDVYAPCQ